MEFRDCLLTRSNSDHHETTHVTCPLSEGSFIYCNTAGAGVHHYSNIVHILLCTKQSQRNHKTYFHMTPCLACLTVETIYYLVFAENWTEIINKLSCIHWCMPHRFHFLSFPFPLLIQFLFSFVNLSTFCKFFNPRWLFAHFIQICFCELTICANMFWLFAKSFVKKALLSILSLNTSLKTTDSVILWF